MATHKQKLKLGFDARAILLPHRTGVENVLYQLLLNLPAQLPQCELLLFLIQGQDLKPASHSDLNTFSALGYRIVEVPLNYPRVQKIFDVWLAWQMRSVLIQHEIDVFYSVNTKFPIGFKSSIVTIHGVEWHGYPQGYRRLERCKQWLWFQLATRFSHGIVTFAEHTRQDVLRIRRGCKIPIVKVPEGVAPMFRVLTDKERDVSVPAGYGVTEPYILSVCSLVPRKNLDGLLRAFATLVHQHHIPNQLVLVGKSGWKSDQLHQIVDRLNICDRVVFTGYVSDHDLIQFYNQAAIFVYPSKYEGFGLPPLEAMRCGLPVITSDRSATREIGQGAAILVNPDDIESMAQGIYQGLSDETLRCHLIQSGFERVAEYSWEKMSRGIAALMLSVK